MAGSVGYYVEVAYYKDDDDDQPAFRVSIDSPTPVGPLREGDHIELKVDGKSTYGRITKAYTTLTMDRGRLISQTTNIRVGWAGVLGFVF